ncbi:hypothetical protein RBB50_007506 [Rhinocladiella similis]
MIARGLALATLATVALAQSSADLITVLNSTEGTSSMAEALAASPLVLEAIKGRTNITVLAPNNTAIELLDGTPQGETIEAGGADFLNNVLLYHIINGGYNNITDYYVAHTFLTSSNYTSVTGGQNLAIWYDDDEDVMGVYGPWYTEITGANKPIPFSQGWIYIVDGVLEIPPVMSTVATSHKFNGTSFVEALNKTGLTSQMDNLSDATYFIPVDDGFDDVACSLSQLSNEELVEVLKYHVIQGKAWLFDDLQNGTQLTTLQGQSLTATETPAGDWFINNAGVVWVNLPSFAGTVFFIDNVLNPHASWSPPVNGSDDGVAAFATCTNGTGSSTPSSSAGVSTATYTGAATPMRTSELGSAFLLAGAALAFAL